MQKDFSLTDPHQPEIGLHLCKGRESQNEVLLLLAPISVGFSNYSLETISYEVTKNIIAALLEVLARN